MRLIKLRVLVCQSSKQDTWDADQFLHEQLQELSYSTVAALDEVGPHSIRSQNSTVSVTKKDE